MIIGSGIDIIEIARIENIMKNPKFIKKMFTENEYEYLRAKELESVAGYFCAKEAVTKALGTGFSGFKFTDIEVLKREGVPYILLKGNALKIAIKKNIKIMHVSISHCKEYATAIAIAEGEVDGTRVGVGEEKNKDAEGEGLINNNYPLCIIKKRNCDSHKGDYGKIFIIGGSYNMSGAIILAARAAFRTGAGLITCVIPKSIIDRVGSLVVEATYIGSNEIDGFVELTEETIDDIIDKGDAIAIGIGMGETDKIKENLLYLINHSNKPIVIDADGISVLAPIKNCLKSSKAQIIITPHSGEMARLLGIDIDYVNNNRLEVAKQFAFEFKCVVLLKGSKTIVTDGDKVYINTTGNPGMASGGSGDVLTGIITSLIGQGYNIFDAAALGAFLHGSAGDKAYSIFGYGLMASDIIDFLGIHLKG